VDKKLKKRLRSQLFRHIDGIAICSTVAIFYKSGLIKYVLDKEKFSIKNIISKFECNPGYMNIALRLLASQGWLLRNVKENDIEFHINSKGKEAFSYGKYYYMFFKSISDFKNIKNNIFEKKYNYKNDYVKVLIQTLNKIANDKLKDDYVKLEVLLHLEGLIAGPLLVATGMCNYFDELIYDNNELDIKSLSNEMPGFNMILEAFQYLKFINLIDGKYYFSEKGIFFIKRSSAYGVTVSYLPTFEKTNDLFFKDPNILWSRDDYDLEMHVDRTMNVWGSGGAHTLYFKKIDEILINIFNQPIESQPIGIADMGCGDGTFLKHLYGVVLNKTLRGRKLDEFPLQIIGADFNKAARLASKITLQNANIKHFILSADISNPKVFADVLKNKYNLLLEDMLNVRSFLDHNRIYKTPDILDATVKCDSTGAFAYRGRLIPNDELKQNLIEHFRSWYKYVRKYGLLILELHTIDPEKIAKNLGLTATTAYDSTHGYSDQYIIEVETMLEAALEAGLVSINKHKINFPSDDLANVSINLLKSKI
tara:strand:- start:268 stop:1878 length:1611 start_codon:yes stop_codon:yes gene_type:complete